MVEFDHLRLRPNLNELDKIARQMAQQFGYTAELSIPRRLANLLRLRVAQLNPCSYCLILHTRVALESGLDSALVAHLPSWRESDMFDPMEAAALDYCEALTEFDLQRFDTAHRDLAGHLSEPAIADIAAVVINMNVWTRLKLAQGATPSAAHDH
jgi:AhpD family alkylhydroperoxidase